MVVVTLRRVVCAGHELFVLLAGLLMEHISQMEQLSEMEHVPLKWSTLVKWNMCRCCFWPRCSTPMDSSQMLVFVHRFNTSDLRSKMTSHKSQHKSQVYLYKPLQVTAHMFTGLLSTQFTIALPFFGFTFMWQTPGAFPFSGFAFFVWSIQQSQQAQVPCFACGLSSTAKEITCKL